MNGQSDKTTHPFVYVLVTFIAFRLMAVLLVRPGGYITTLSDFTFYRLLASYASQGFYPSVHYWMEYQPLFPWIPVGIYRLSLMPVEAAEVRSVKTRLELRLERVRQSPIARTAPGHVLDMGQLVFIQGVCSQMVQKG